MNSEVTARNNAISSAIASEVTNRNSAIATETSARQAADTTLQNNINVQKARIDQITNLPSGSTTGDAELQDIRIAYDGTTYSNAGTSVRTQVSNIINGHSDNLYNYSTANELTGNIANGIINGSSSNYGIVFNCTSNTEYVISIGYSDLFKFCAGTTTTNPLWNTAVNVVVDGTGSAKLTIKTGSNDNYIYLQCYNTSLDSGHTKAEVFQSIVISKVCKLEDVKNLENAVSIHYVGSGEEFTKLTDAFDYSMTVHNVTFVIKSGTYDIYQELGASYFSTFERNMYGPKIGNNNIYLFSPNAKVVFNYTGSREVVMTWFSPINIAGSCIIKGLNARVSNCRYPLHDDVGAFGTTAEYIEIEGCELYKDNSSNSYFQNNICIGSGLSPSGVHIIKNCIIDATVNSIGGISVHNNGDNNTHSVLIISNNVCKGPGQSIHIQCAGSSTDVTDCICSNNILKQDIAKTVGSAADNMNIISINNIIQNS